MFKWIMAMVSMFLLTPMSVLAQDAGDAPVLDAGIISVATSVSGGVAVVPPEGFDLVPALVIAAQGGQWSLFAALIIMFLVWAVTKAPLISNLIKGEAKVWTASIAGTLLAVGTSIFVQTPDTVGEWLSTIFSGLTVGLAATGMWELVHRKASGKPIDADGDGKIDP